MFPLFFAVRLPTLLAMLWRRYISREPVTGSSPREPGSLIIFRLDSLGDVVMTTPLFRALKQLYAESRCTVVVEKAYKSVLVTNPFVDEILTMPRIRPVWLPQGARRLVAAVWLYWTRLRKRHFDVAICPRWDVDEHLGTFLCVLTHAGRRIGFSENSMPAKRQINRGFDAAFDTCLPPGPVRHEVLRNLAVAEALGASVSGLRPEIHLTQRDRKRARQLLANVSPAKKLLALGIGARSPGRQWPLERYAETIRQLAGEFSVQPVILCSEDESGDAVKLSRLLRQCTPVIVSGAGIREVCAVLERCELFIGNDSGCAHLAAAMNCEALVLSRHPRDGDPNHCNSPLRFTPYGTRVRVLQPQSGLDSCREACAVAEPHCITRISAEEVIAAAQPMLRELRGVATAPPLPAGADAAANRLLYSHSAHAIRQAVEALGAVARVPVLRSGE